MNPNDPTASYYDIVYSEIKGKEVINEELLLIKRILASNKKAKILDIGCGTGRHFIPLTQEGFSLEGVEPSKGMRNLLKQKATVKPIIYSKLFLKAKIEPKMFDLQILMWNVLNEMALTIEDLDLTLKKIAKLKNKKGKVLINIDDVTKITLPDISDIYYFQTQGKKYKSIFECISYDPQVNTTVSRETIEVYDLKTERLLESVSTEITQRWWSKEELKQSAAKAELKFTKTYNIKSNEELYLIFA